MSQSSSKGPPTHLLVEASEILRSLNPLTLASLLLVAEDTQYTQGEMAAEIGCASSTVSKSQQSLRNLPVALIEKRGRSDIATDMGTEVLDRFSRLSERFGIDLETVNWADEEERTSVATILTPLYNSRSVTPFFILDAYGLSDYATSSTPSLRIANIVHHVNSRQQDRGESATPEQVRQRIYRLDEADVLRFDDGNCLLLEKGQRQRWLLDQITQLVTNHREIDHPIQESPDTEVRTNDSRSDADRDRHRTGAAQPIAPRGFYGSGQPSGGTSETIPEEPIIVTALCLYSPETDTVEVSPHTHSSSHFQHVLPVMHSSLGDIIDRLTELADEYSDDTRIEPYWVLRTSSGLYPLAPAQLPLSEASHRAWAMLNEAYHLWNSQSADEFSNSNES